MNAIEIWMTPWWLIAWFVVIAGLVIAAYRYGWYRRWREFKAAWREWADAQAVSTIKDNEREIRYLRRDNERLAHDLGQAQSEQAAMLLILTKKTVDAVGGPDAKKGKV